MDQVARDSITRLIWQSRSGYTVYLIMAMGLVIFMAIIHFSSLPESEFTRMNTTVVIDDTTRFGVLQFPQLVLGALTLFAYVGVEVIAGDTIGLYGQNLGVQTFRGIDILHHGLYGLRLLY